jgi:hypothetical protein
VTARGEVSSMDKVRLFMESAERTEFDLKVLRELAEKHPQRAQYSLEELALVEDVKAWAILMASGLVRMGDFLDKHSRGHVDGVAEEAYQEIDSRRPRAYWLAKEDEALDEEISWMADRAAFAEESVHLDTEYVDE